MFLALAMLALVGLQTEASDLAHTAANPTPTYAASAALPHTQHAARDVAKRHEASARWITHRVVRGESPTRVADRYGCSVDQLMTWNPWLRSAGMKPGKILQIQTTRAPVPTARSKTVHIVRAGETLESIAKQHGVAVSMLRPVGPHARAASARPGERLVVWRGASSRPWDPTRRGIAIAPPTVARGGMSRGAPNAGELVDGVPIPESSLYELPHPQLCYGSTHAVTHLVAAIARFRSTGWSGRLLINSMSKAEGGPFPPHKSHRSGRDVDIRLPALDGSGAPVSNEAIDWHATWALVRALLDTEQVDMIFLDRDLWPLLERAANELQASPRDLGLIGSKIRDSFGHDTHMHVRFSCGPSEADCRGVTFHGDETPD